MLVTSTADGLQEQTERIKYALGLGGLRLNPAKCATLRIDIDSGAKHWIANPTEFVTLDESQVKALNIIETHKYLGVQAGPRGLRRASSDALTTAFDRLTRAPLKPQQRIYNLHVALLCPAGSVSRSSARRDHGWLDLWNNLIEWSGWPYGSGFIYPMTCLWNFSMHVRETVGWRCLG